MRGLRNLFLFGALIFCSSVEAFKALKQIKPPRMPLSVVQINHAEEICISENPNIPQMLSLQYEQILDRYPLATKMASGAVIGAIGDLLAQMTTTTSYDWLQTVTMTTVSGIFMAPMLHLWFNLLEVWTVSLKMNHKQKTIIQLLIDQSLGALFITSYFFYSFSITNTLLRYSAFQLTWPSCRIIGEIGSQANRLVHKKLWSTLQLNWKFWPGRDGFLDHRFCFVLTSWQMLSSVVNYFVFQFVPLKFRSLVSSLAGLIWTVILSLVMMKD